MISSVALYNEEKKVEKIGIAAVVISYTYNQVSSLQRSIISVFHTVPGQADVIIHYRYALYKARARTCPLRFPLLSTPRLFEIRRWRDKRDAQH